MTHRSPARRPLVSTLLYVLYLAAVLAAVVWVCHWRYVAGLRRHRAEPPRHAVPQIDAATMARLGWLQTPRERASSFANFPEAKPPRTIRVGCYGDSFTWGAEVADGFDYPAVLGQVLRARGHPEFEVLNLGVSGYGLHQTAMLHEVTAERWQLDRAVLLAMPFWTARDLTFMAPWSDDRIHARYVLDDGGVRRMDVVGDTYEERLARYHALLAPWRYWRYDRRPPALLRALLPAGRTIPNPWYYRDDAPAHEARATYRALVPRLDGPTRPLLILDPEESGPRLVPEIGGVARATVSVPDGFPFRAPGRHLSPWGTRRLAAQVADVLLGPPATPEPSIAVTPLPRESSAPPGAMPPHELEDLAVTLDDLRVGDVVTVDGRGREPTPTTRLPPSVRTLVALAAERSTPLTDAVFVGAESDADVVATVTVGDRVRRLAAARAAGVTLAIRRLDVCGDHAVQELLGVPPDTPCRVATPRGSRRSPDAVVAIGGTPVLVGGMSGDAILFRATGRRYLVRARGDVAPAIERLPAAGRVWLEGRDASGSPHREPLAEWRVE